MAKDNESIEIKVEVDTSDVKKSMQDVAKETDNMAKNIKKSGDKAEDSFDGLTKGLKTMQRQMKNMFKNMNMNGFKSSLNSASKSFSSFIDGAKKQLDSLFNTKENLEIKSTLTTDASGAVSGHTGLLNSMLTGGAIGSQTAKQMALMKDSIIEAVKGSASSFNGLSDTIKSTIVDAVMVGQDALDNLKTTFEGIDGVEFDPRGALLGYIHSITIEMEQLEEEINQVQNELNNLYMEQADAEADGMEIQWSDGSDGIENSIAELKELQEQLEHIKKLSSDYQSQLQLFNTISGFDGLVDDINELAEAYQEFKENADMKDLIVKMEQFRNVVRNAGGDTEVFDNAISKYNENMKNSSILTAKTKDAIQSAVQQMNNFKKAGEDVARSLSEQNKGLNSISKSGSNLYGSLKQLVSGFKSVNKEQDNVAKSAKKTESAFKSLAKSLAPYLGLAAIFGGLKKSITSYTDSLQDSSKFGLVFGSETQNMTDWLNELNSTVTTSKGTLMDFSSNLFRMSRNMGATTDDSIAMAKSMTELGADLVAFTNDANSIEALAGALRGEYDSLQNYGYALDAASVEAEAMALGLDTASESALLFARQSLILKQSGDVLGYGATQAKTLGGQLAMLQKNFQALGAAIGSCFAGLLQVVLPVLNSIVSAVTSAFNKIASVINSIFGLFGIKVGGGSASGGGTVGGVIGDAVGGISDALGSGLDGASGGAGDVADSLADGAESAKELKKYLAGVDELNLTPEKSQPSGGSGSGSSGGSGGSGGGAGGLGGLGDAVGGVATETEKGANIIQETIQETADWIVKLVDNLKSVWNALKTGFLSVSDYINTSIANLKQAFINLGNSMQSFLLGAWQNGGEELVYNFGRLGGALTGAIIDIAGQCVQMVADLFAYLNPDTNPYTRMFITGLNNLLVACQNFALSVGGWFKTFVDNGGQAFLNVMGDIMMILGAIFTQLLADAVNAVTAFMNSWAGQTLISAVAISLNVVAGVIKALLVVVKQFLPVFEALIILFGLLKLSQVINDFRTFQLSMLASQTATLTFGQKLAFTQVKLGLLKTSLINCTKQLGKFVTNGLKKAVKGVYNLGIKTVDLTKKMAKFIAQLASKALTGMKNVFLHPIKTLKTLGTTIVTCTKNTIAFGKAMLVNAWNSIKSLITSMPTAIASFLGLSTAEGTATAGAVALQLALSALGIGLIVAAIVGLIAVFKNWDKITAKVKELWEKFMGFLQEKCPWLYNIFKAIGDVFGWVKDKVGALWDGVKSFFGWEGDNKVEEEINETDDSLSGLGDTIEETSDRFGTATSAINQSLSSIGIDSNKLALQLDEAEAMFNEKFGMISANAKEYLDAVTSGNEEMLSQMAGDADKYLAEIQSAFNDMSVAEQAVFYATYGEINGVTDGWLDYTKGSYEEALIKHTGMLESIKNNENLTYDEKLKRIDEEKEAFKTAQDEKLAKLNETIAAMESEEWQSEDDRYRAIQPFYEQRNQLIADMEEYQLGSIDTVDEAVKASAQAQEDAYNNVGNSQEQALEGVSTALDTTKTDLQGFKEESDKVAKEIPEAWAGIGETISEEFDEASNEVVKSLNTMNNKVKGQANTLKTTLKSAFATINDGTKKSMTTMTNNIKQAFDKMSKNIKTQMQQIATELQARFTQINNGLNKSFTTMSTQVITVLKNMATQISSSLKGVETTFKTSMNNISNVAKTKIQEACKTITSKVEAMKQPITNSFNGIKTNVGNSLDALNKTVTNKMQVVLNTVKRFVNQLQNATNFTFKTPYMRMPHINVHGDWNFEKKTTPSFSVKWYSDGGIFNKRSLIGVGDKYHGIGNNAEAVVPLDSMYKNIRNIVKEENKANTGDTRPITITLNMDGKELARGTVNSMKDLARIGALDLSFL